MKRLFGYATIVAIAAIGVPVAVTAPAVAKGPPGPTVTLTCAPGTYGVVEGLLFVDKNGTIVTVADADVKRECGDASLAPGGPKNYPSSGRVDTTGKAAAYGGSEFSFYCDDGQGHLGTTFPPGSALPKGNTPIVVACDASSGVTLTID